MHDPGATLHLLGYRTLTPRLFPACRHAATTYYCINIEALTPFGMMNKYVSTPIDIPFIDSPQRTCIFHYCLFAHHSNRHFALAHPPTPGVPPYAAERSQWPECTRASLKAQQWKPRAQAGDERTLNTKRRAHNVTLLQYWPTLDQKCCTFHQQRKSSGVRSDWTILLQCCRR